MTDSNRILSFHADPGHGWLAASIDAEIREAKLSTAAATSYINRDEGMAYLEEDCDAMVFINHLKKNNVPFTISENTHKRRSIPSGATNTGPRNGIPSPDVQQWLDSTTSRLYKLAVDVNFTSSRSKHIAEEIVFRDIGPDDDESRVYDLAHEYADGSEHVIYYYKAHQFLGWLDARTIEYIEGETEAGGSLLATTTLPPESHTTHCPI